MVRRACRKAGLIRPGVSRRPFHLDVTLASRLCCSATENGEVVHAGSGEILITPQGNKGIWKSLSPVRKFWAIFEE